MKVVKSLVLVFATGMLTYSAHAQTATTTAPPRHDAGAEKQSTTAPQKSAEIAVTPSKAPDYDQVNTKLTGPNKETVYTDAQGDYYFAKSGKTYLPK